MAGEERIGASRGWLQSPAYDLGFFLLTPLVGLAYLAANAGGAATLALVGATLIGIPHYLSTFTFLCWEENRAHHRARWLAFFAGPLILAALFFGAVQAGAFVGIQFVTYFWNAYHVSRQSSGFVSLYRHRAGVSDVEHRRWAGGTVLWANASCAFFGLRHHGPVNGLLEQVHPELPRVLLAGASVLALGFVLGLVRSYARRRAEGRGPRLPEVGALVTGVALFHPYLWYADSERATLTLLLGHFVQYLGLVWLLQRRRQRQRADARPGWLARLSASTPLLIMVASLSGALFLSGRLLARQLEVESAFNALFILLTYTHFYLDGLLWSFRDPHVRRTLGSMLAGTGSPS